MGRCELSLHRPGTVFVNVSSRAILQTDALIKNLKSGDVVASLDVFEPEPVPPDSPVHTMPNAFLSPHIAGTTMRGRTRFFEEMVNELPRHFSGHENLINLTRETLANRRGD
jgi:phosphoglycerate dehydrogenase-like enzyme